MKITADTNVLLRNLLNDDEAQAQSAREALESADLVALTLQSLCEMVWVLRSAYRISNADIALQIRELIDSENTVAERPPVEAGLRVLEAGGDFADGVIAYEGQRLGGELFVSFDRKAVTLVKASGQPVKLLR